MSWSTLYIDLQKQKARRLITFKSQTAGINNCKKYKYGTKTEQPVDSQNQAQLN